MGRMSGIIYFVPLSLAVTAAVFAFTLAGRGLGFAEYGVFLLLAAILWVASIFFRSKPR